MVNKEEAMELANRQLLEIQKMSTYKLALLSEVTEFEYGWMFFYQSEEFVLTGDVNYMLGGNAPIIVDRFNSAVVITGTNKSEEFYIEMYCKYRDDIKEYKEIISR